ncbi:MAG: DUF167 domain-containing protein [Candidatus Eiseniibacteriota bacterium]
MTRVNVRVQPGARRNVIRGWLESGELRVAVSAPPEGGRANQAVVELLAEALALKSRAVSLTRGASSRSKSFEVEGLDESEARRRIDAAIQAGAEHRARGE